MTRRRDLALIGFGWALCFLGVILAALIFAGCGKGCPAAQHPGAQPDQSPGCPRH